MKSVADLLPGASGICRFYHADKCLYHGLYVQHWERLIQWQVKINNNLGDDQQFLIQIQSAPPKTKLTPGPARLHIQDRRFCMTSGVPPRLSGQWEIHHLRKYGVVDTGRFCFEGGSRCGKGEGLFILITDQAEELSRTFKLAAEGKIASKRRTISRNMS
ncbi:protein Dok-7-like, partial [Diaphorina citri]|uniref:Protein Dok-7-like n=1 Tax=Diaphorina citri TaxID=121845 RepID=A0A1S3DF76_DIACI